MRSPYIPNSLDRLKAPAGDPPDPDLNQGERTLTGQLPDDFYPPRPPRPWRQLSDAEKHAHRRVRLEWRRRHLRKTFEAMRAYIRKVRKKGRLTQQELADILKVKRSTVVRWETGQSFPDLPHRIKIQQLDWELDEQRRLWEESQGRVDAAVRDADRDGEEGLTGEEG